jgi:hypothetical protein
VPGGHQTILGGVLAKRGEEDAVLEGSSTEGDGLVESGRKRSVALGRVGGSRRRVLSGGEVGDLLYC